MRTVRSYVALAAVFALVIACGPKVAPGTPPPAPGVSAGLAVVEIEKRIGRAADVVIAANHAGDLPDRVAVPTAKALLSINEIVHAGRDGWLAAARQVLDELKKQLPAADVEKYAAYFEWIDAILASKEGGTHVADIAGNFDQDAPAGAARLVPAPAR